MGTRQEQAAALRRRLAQNNSRHNGENRALGHRAVDSCLGGGLKRGALHEVFPATSRDAAAATGFTLALARRMTAGNRWLLWIQQDFSALECGELCGSGLAAFGIDPARFMMVKVPAAAAALRAGADAITCSGVDTVVIESWGAAKVFDLVASRKLTLSAARHGVTVFTLRHAALPTPSTAETRWSLRIAEMTGGDWKLPRFAAELQRNRHGATGSWIMEWDCDGRFVETQADPCGIPAAAFDRPAAPPKKVLRQAG